MKKRLNIQIETSVDDYLQEQATKLGISKNAFINVVIAEYTENQFYQSKSSDLSALIEELKELKIIKLGK
jgi:hypothetical protein